MIDLLQFIVFLFSTVAVGTAVTFLIERMLTAWRLGWRPTASDRLLLWTRIAEVSRQA